MLKKTKLLLTLGLLVPYVASIQTGNLQWGGYAFILGYALWIFVPLKESTKPPMQDRMLNKINQMAGINQAPTGKSQV